MENNTIETIQAVVPSPQLANPDNGDKPLINKKLSIRKKTIIASIIAVISVGVTYYLFPKKTNAPIVSENNSATESILVKGKQVPVAQIQVKYQKAFKHLKRMDVYYRQARDFLLDLNYEQAVRKCDSALLCKTEKPLNWTAQKWGDVYNIQAESLLYLGKIADAERASINALKMDKTDKLGYLHLIYAQIIAAKEKKATPLFLDNFKFALKKQLPVWDYMELDGFDAVQKDPSVKKLLKQYKTE
jgi:tetratricopeptide (TPR) repeat protein